MGLSDPQMQTSIVILTNEYGTPTIQIPSVNIVKLEHTDDNVLMLSTYEDDMCVDVDFSDTLSLGKAI